MKNSVKKVIIFTLITCTSYLTIACSASKYVVESISVSKEYILNKNSKKVHSIDCASAKRISSKNKEIIIDTIGNICNNGYVICKNCKAGLKNYNLKLKYELPTREEYLASIEDIGRWYVDNVATYQKEIEEEKKNDYLGNAKYIKTYDLIDRKYSIFGKRQIFNVITEDVNGKMIDGVDKNEDIARANENAINNYRDNYKSISFEKNLAYYKCKYIDDCKSYKKAGDDCVRFVFTILNNIDKEFVYDIEKISKNKWRRINTKVFLENSTDFAIAMISKGFDIYDTVERSIDIDKDGISDGKINKIDSNFELKKGDIIVRKNHIHVFIDDKMNEANNFGWGKVNRQYPNVYSFDTYNDGNNCYIVCDSDRNINGDYNQYTRVYRYIGG